MTGAPDTPSSPAGRPRPAAPAAVVIERGLRFAWRRLEVLVLIHVGCMGLFSSWAFGGNIWWARDWLTLWGGLGLPLAALALSQPGVRGSEVRQRAWVFLPWVLAGALVVVGCLNPSFVRRTMDGQAVLIHLGEAHPWLPSTVSPSVSLARWAFAGGAWLAACNLWLVVRRRRALRLLLAAAAVNTLVLAVFGTLQKLLVPASKNADGFYSGFYFGSAVSPQERFFSTFIYNNHWGAFMVLFLAVGFGLLFYFAARRPHGRDQWHTPVPATLAAGFFIALSAPMSASRSATALAGLVIAVATGVALRRITAARR